MGPEYVADSVVYGRTKTAPRPDTSVLQTIQNHPEPKEGALSSKSSVEEPTSSTADAAMGVPSDWSTPEDPRCEKHSSLPADRVPACRACGQARKCFETQAEAERQLVPGRSMPVTSVMTEDWPALTPPVVVQLQ